MKLSREFSDPCPCCLKTGAAVIDSRPWHSNPAWRRRRRKCPDCGNRWDTIEVPLSLLQDGFLGTRGGGGIHSVVREVELAEKALQRFRSRVVAAIGREVIDDTAA